MDFDTPPFSDRMAIGDIASPASSKFPFTPTFESLKDDSKVSARSSRTFLSKAFGQEDGRTSRLTHHTDESSSSIASSLHHSRSSTTSINIIHHTKKSKSKKLAKLGKKLMSPFSASTTSVASTLSIATTANADKSRPSITPTSISYTDEAVPPTPKRFFKKDTITPRRPISAWVPGGEDVFAKQETVKLDPAVTENMAKIRKIKRKPVPDYTSPTPRVRTESEGTIRRDGVQVVVEPPTWRGSAVSIESDSSRPGSIASSTSDYPSYQIQSVSNSKSVNRSSPDAEHDHRSTTVVSILGNPLRSNSQLSVRYQDPIATQPASKTFQRRLTTSSYVSSYASSYASSRTSLASQSTTGSQWQCPAAWRVMDIADECDEDEKNRMEDMKEREKWEKKEKGKIGTKVRKGLRKIVGK